MILTVESDSSSLNILNFLIRNIKKLNDLYLTEEYNKTLSV